jgi:hypothetical protein
MKTKKAGLLIVFLASLLMLPSLVTTQGIFKFQYTAKFICLTNIPGTSLETDTVLPGGYVTDVNIHNPNKKKVKLRKKLAVTFPPGEQRPGPVTKFIEEGLGADEAFEVDCGDTAKFEFQPIHGWKGFLVIESTGELDVTAVYTAGGSDLSARDQVESIAVERIPGRKITP